MNANQELWEKGDFTRIAATMRESGEELVKELGITNGMQVLDLGGGDGTTALPAARLGADVVVIDIARNLVEAGTRRAAEEGLTTSASSRATPATSTGCPTTRSISSSPSSGRCSHPTRSHVARRWCGSRSRVGGS